MNYKIIMDEEKLLDFINNFLPELKDNECYYACLFARSKYCKNFDGTNVFPHIKSDKAQLKRFVVSDKKYLFNKLKQLEVEVGAYKTKDGMDIPQESLAVYITINPRNQQRAMFRLQKRLIDIQECCGMNFNINAEALSAIQRSKSRTVYLDVDFDGINFDETINILHDYINTDAFKVLHTRGGFHLLISPKMVSDKFKNTYYNNIMSMNGVDKPNAPTKVKYDNSNNIIEEDDLDNMIPIPGCYQGGFVPYIS